MKLTDHKNSKKQGDAGLGIAIGWFTEQGYTVCIPLTDSQDYDLVIDIQGRLQKVQVKTATRYRYGGWVSDLRVKGGNKSGTGKTKVFDPTQIDLLFIITGDRTLYLIPSVSVQGQATISLGSKYTEFKVTHFQGNPLPMKLKKPAPVTPAPKEREDS
jgi:hypothetical protein